MSDQNQGGGKRKQKIPASKTKVELWNQESPPIEPETASTRQESKVDTLLRNIFFSSGPLPMAPDSSE
ncbi:MAG: hypothetical protein NTV55_14370 [Planctomycetota bacterium]|nr:hypothetical protein [Planctomycetota bacterium]